MELVNTVLKAVLVGASGRGRWAVSLLHADPHWTITGLVDVNPDALSEAQDATGIESKALFGDVREALATVDADVVIACTPTATHAPIGRIAFDAGKHYLVEKGMTLDWREANELVRAADAANVRFCVAQNYRYHAVTKAVGAILADSAHPHYPGRIEIADLMHHRYRPLPRTLNYPFAMVWDMSCHHVDLLNAWLGAATRVTAVSSNPSWSKYEHDADIAAVIEYDGGAVCHYLLTHAAAISDYRLILQGERGALRAFDQPGLRFTPLPDQPLGSADPTACEVPDLPASEQGVVDDFYRYIVNGIEPGISGRNNLRTLAVCEMLVRSATERRTVEAGELE